MDRVISYLTLLVLSVLSVAGQVIEQECNFAGDPTIIQVSETLGRNVCIRQVDTDPSSAGKWHFIACQNANNFRVTGDKGNAVLCRDHRREDQSKEPGIGIDFPSGNATVKRLKLVCENSSGTTMEVIDITVDIRPEGSIVFLSQSSDNKVDVTIGDTTVIAKFIGRVEDLDQMVIPDGVDCNRTMFEADNCRLAADSGGSELSRTCTVTPQTLNDGGMRIFSRPNGAILASVEVNVRPNNTGATPITATPPELDVGEILGIALGVPVLMLLFILVVIVIFVAIFFYIVWRVGPGVSPQQGDQERGELPPSRFSYVAFGEGIPQAVKSSIVSHYNVEEFKLNGSSVEDRFGQSNERFLFVTKSSEYKATIPSGTRGSSLTAQMRQLATRPGNRVHVVKLPDRELEEPGQLGTDGVPPVIAIINESMQGEPCIPTQRQSSTDSRILTSIHSHLQSLHKMVFQMRTEGLPTATNMADEPNGHVPAGDGDRDDDL